MGIGWSSSGNIPSADHRAYIQVPWETKCLAMHGRQVPLPTCWLPPFLQQSPRLPTSLNSCPDRAGGGMQQANLIEETLIVKLEDSKKVCFPWEWTKKQPISKQKHQRYNSGCLMQKNKQLKMHPKKVFMTFTQPSEYPHCNVACSAT